MASLRELQHSFAAALRDPTRVCTVTPVDNLGIYRNNASHNFAAALAGSFPVLRRRVGDDYFRQLAALYRERHPSRSGDLHWVGRWFAPFLEEHLAEGDYAWLAELARLEWAREESAVSAELPALGPEVLAAHPPEALEHLSFGLQPSLRLVESAYPVFSVWMANQIENAPPVDQFLGPEQGLSRIRSEFVEIQNLPSDVFSYISALANGIPLGEAMTITGIESARLAEILGFLFGSDLVIALEPTAIG
jgi:hypothetical protein